MRKAILLMAALFALAGCGGGGGGDGAASGAGFSVSFSPSPLNLSLYPDQLSNDIVVTATVSGQVPAGYLYVFVVDTAANFSQEVLTPVNTGPNRYSATLHLDSSKPVEVGTRSSTLQVQFCGDPGCSAHYLTASLPYSITTLSPKVTFPVSPLTATALNGNIARVTADLAHVPDFMDFYARISDSSNTFVDGATVLVAREFGEDHYTVELPVRADAGNTSHQGTLSLRICGNSSTCATPGAVASAPYLVQVLKVLAGQIAQRGESDGAGTAAAFGSPRDITLDSAGNLYVTDAYSIDLNTNPDSYKIRKITPGGVVSTVMNSADPPSPFAIAVDSGGNLFFGNSNGGIDKLTPGGERSHFSNASAASLAVDSADNLYATDYNHQVVVQFTPAGELARIISDAAFVHPFGVAVDSFGNAYVSDTVKVFKWTPDDVVTPYIDTLNTPQNLAMGPGNALFVRTFDGIYKVMPFGTVTKVLSDGAPPVGATGPSQYPTGGGYFKVTPGGTMYLVDTLNSVVYETVLP